MRGNVDIRDGFQDTAELHMTEEAELTGQETVIIVSKNEVGYMVGGKPKMVSLNKFYKLIEGEQSEQTE